MNRRIAAAVLCIVCAAWLGAGLVNLSGRWLRWPAETQGMAGTDPARAAQSDAGQPDAAAAASAPDSAGRTAADAAVTATAAPRRFATWRQARAAIDAAATAPERARLAAAWAAGLAERTSPVEEGGRVYFFYHGPASRVSLSGDFNGWTDTLLERVAGTDLWVAGLALPDEAIVAYRLRVNGRGQVDEHNPLQTRALGNRFSVYLGPGARARGADPPPEPAPGELHELHLPSRHLGRSVRVLVHLPPGCMPQTPCPAVYVFDGPFYLTEGRLAQILAAQAAAGVLPPMAVVALDPGQDPLRRLVETLPGLGQSQRTLAFLARELVPAIEARFPVRAGRHHRTVMGMSAGGAAAVEAGLTYPELFGRVLAQSPAVLPALRRQAEAFAGQPPVVYINWGQFEQNIFGLRLAVDAEGLARLLAQSGFAVRTHSAQAGHNMMYWRRTAGPGLAWLWAQPLSNPY